MEDEKLHSFLRKRVRNVLESWAGSEAEKDRAGALLLEDIIKTSEEEPDKRKRGKLLHSQGRGISDFLKRQHGHVSDILNVKINAQSMCMAQAQRNAENRKMFDDITSHHKRLAVATSREGSTWEVAIKSGDLTTYAGAAEKMKEKEWVQIGHLWMQDFATEYFINEQWKAFSMRAVRRAFKNLHGRGMTPVEREELARQYLPQPCDIVRLIDVGSCYNPFAANKRLQVTALDLCPRHPSVLRCDFLQLAIGPPQSEPIVEFVVPDGCEGSQTNPAGSPILMQLPENCADVVCMSLVLSYLPTYEQRANMVAKARRLLICSEGEDSRSQCHIPLLPPQRRGLLLILEKASILNTTTHSPLLLHCWKRAVANLGFELLTYKVLTAGHRSAHAFAFAVSTGPGLCEARSGAKLWIRQDFDDSTALESEISKALECNPLLTSDQKQPTVEKT